MATLYRCIIGPRLYKTYRTVQSESRVYEGNAAEKYGDHIIRSLSLMWSISIYTSPVIIGVLYKRGYFSIDGIFSFLKFVTLVGLAFMSSLMLRGIGRYKNPEYATFLAILQSARINFSADTKRALSKYDFDFSAWPVEFRLSDVEGSMKKAKVERVKPLRKRTIVERIGAFPCEIIGFVVAHTFGRRMVYPGAVQILQSTMAPMLLSGRSKLVEEYNGERVKLLSKEKNDIEIMVVDRRSQKNMPRAETLVICSEGNAGFYEIGIMSTPLEAGYSVVGWNHPGFGGSTGVPFPDQEGNAIDVILQYAIHRLHFLPSNIVLFAWSIGGYTASWAAMHYPEVRAVILDATFDDLVPLAVSKMPPSWKPLIVRTIRDYINLNVAEQLLEYPGPVLIIRRSKDEMITTDEIGSIATNRGNNLLIKLLQHRYPHLVDDDTIEILRNWLAIDSLGQERMWRQLDVDEDLCKSTYISYISENSNSFPLLLGNEMDTSVKIQMVLFLARRHMIDYNSTHCTPLPAHLFQMPWDPTALLDDFVQVCEADTCSKEDP